jgi:hypothetical protein
MRRRERKLLWEFVSWRREGPSAADEKSGVTVGVLCECESGFGASLDVLRSRLSDR